jgi:HlyD family secretion protein
MKRIVIAGSIVLVAGAAILLFARRNTAEAADYRFVPVTRGDIESTVNATGTLGAVQTVSVGTQVSGQIAALYADFNDRVRKGELIATLDPTLLQEAVNQAQADAARAEADLKQKQYLYNQTDTLYKGRIVTETEYRTALYNLQQSQASVASAQANLDRARRNLAYASIYAPISGVVIDRKVQVGQTVAASLQAPELFTIAEDLAHMQILVSVDESDIGQIRQGQLARFTVQAYPARAFEGTVQQVRMQSTTTENVVNYTAVVAVDNPDGALLPGMTATVSFQVARAAAVLKVPNAALRLRPTESMLAAVGRRGGSAPDSTAAARGFVRRDSTRGADSTRTGVRGGANGVTRQESGGEAASARGTTSGTSAGARIGGTAQLWYIDTTGKLAVARVRTGLSDGQETEISAADVHEGMQVIAAITSASTPAAQPGVSSPFQTTQQGRGAAGGRGGRPGGF